MTMQWLGAPDDIGYPNYDGDGWLEDEPDVEDLCVSPSCLDVGHDECDDCGARLCRMHYEGGANFCPDCPTYGYAERVGLA